MERIAMRTENELTMRNLRNLNQELQAQVREVKCGYRIITKLNRWKWSDKKKT